MMRGKFVLVVVMVAWAAGVFAQDQASELRQLAQAVRTLEAKVDSMRQDLAALKKKDGGVDVCLPCVSGRSGRGADLSQLRKIKLPPNPTDDQINYYLDQIAAASAGQNSFSNADPQIWMYQAIGPDKLNLLLEHMVWQEQRMSASYLKAAVKAMVREQDKKLILNALPRIPSLVEVVIKQHWEKDAKQILLDRLANNNSEWLPAGWVQAVANLKDPQTYGLLKDHFVRGGDHYSTFADIRALPGLDLTDAVNEIWEKGYARSEFDGMAAIAFEYGHLDAMDSLLDLMDNAKMREIEETIRPLLYRHLEVRGTTKQLRAWLDQNRANIKFDPKDKKYKVVPPTTAAKP